MLRLLLRLFLSSFLLLWLILASGCSTTPAQQVAGLRAKPTTCLLPLPPQLAPLPAEFDQLSAERGQLVQKFQAEFVTLSPDDRQSILNRVLAIDYRQAEILLQLEDDAGAAYVTAMTNLGDCQAWVRAQP